MMKAFEHGKTNKMIRLWVHECGRVFADRLNDEADVQKLYEYLDITGQEIFKEYFYKAIEDVAPIEMLAKDSQL